MISTDKLKSVKQKNSIVGNSSKLNHAIERAMIVAPYDQSVLVLGESGAGKEFFPKIIHTNSPRHAKKYIAINCGAIPEGTIDSELFGHVKGAFTDAAADRKGYFEEANGGTIFLDEVAELPMTTQARLLRVLENGEFIKVGSNNVLKTNVRIVAATNVNLKEAIKAGRFREDLYYRLSTIIIEVPSLRERGAGDIRLLAQKFVNDFDSKYKISGFTSFTDSAMDMICRYTWPGNVRQLKNVMEQIGIFHAGETIDAGVLTEYMPEDAGVSTSLVSTGNMAGSNTEREFMLNAIFDMKNKIDELQKKLDQYEGFMHGSMRSFTQDNRFVESKCAQPEPQSNNTEDFFDMESGQRFVREKNEVQDIAVEEQKYEEPEQEAPVKTLEEIEREAIIDSLHRNKNNRQKTANELGISARNLYRKIDQYKKLKES